MEREENRRNEIYECITEFIFENGFAPTLREICDWTGLNSVSTVHYHLRMLEQMGMIKVKFGCPRAISILRDEKREEACDQAARARN